MNTKLYNMYNGTDFKSAVRHYISRKLKNEKNYKDCKGCAVYTDYCYVVWPGKNHGCPCQNCIVKTMCKYVKKMSCDIFCEFMGVGGG